MLFNKQDIGLTDTCLKFYQIGHSGDHAATEPADLHTMVFMKRGCVSLRTAEREYMLTSNSMADFIPPECVEITAASTDTEAWRLTFDDRILFELFHHPPFPIGYVELLKRNPVFQPGADCFDAAHRHRPATSTGDAS